MFGRLPSRQHFGQIFPSDLMEDSAHYVLVLLLGSLDVTHILKNSAWLVGTTESRIMVARLKIVDLITYVLYDMYKKKYDMYYIYIHHF